MKTKKEEVNEVLKTLEGFKNFNIYTHLSESGKYDKIFEEAKSDEEREAAEEYAKALSNYFSKQITDIVNEITTPQGLENFFNILNERFKANGDKQEQ